MKIVLGWEKHTYISVNIKRSDSKTAIKQLVYFPVAMAPLSLTSVTPGVTANWSLLALSCLSAEQETSG